MKFDKVPGRKKIVYFIYRQSDSAMKVGMSANVSRRLYQLRVKHGDSSLKLVAYIPGYRKMEYMVHFLLRSRCEMVGGEWFRYNTYMKDFIFHYGILVSELPKNPEPAKRWPMSKHTWPLLDEMIEFIEPEQPAE